MYSIYSHYQSRYLVLELHGEVPSHVLRLAYTIGTMCPNGSASSIKDFFATDVGVWSTGEECVGKVLVDVSYESLVLMLASAGIAIPSPCDNDDMKTTKAGVFRLNSSERTLIAGTVDRITYTFGVRSPLLLHGSESISLVITKDVDLIEGSEEVMTSSFVLPDEFCESEEVIDLITNEMKSLRKVIASSPFL